MADKFELEEPQQDLIVEGDAGCSRSGANSLSAAVVSRVASQSGYCTDRGGDVIVGPTLATTVFCPSVVAIGAGFGARQLQAPVPAHSSPAGGTSSARERSADGTAHAAALPPPPKFAFIFGNPCLGSPMVLVVLLIFGWSWYVHVLIMDRALLSADLALGLADLAVWHLLLVCAICAYLRTVFTQPGYTTTGQGANSLQALEAGLSDAVRDARFCQICSSYKPQRCHHCRMCGRCVEKMDHHCPWVANCVGKNNHKFFILFLLYTSLVANYNVLTIALWFSRNPQTIFVSFSDRILHCGVTVDSTWTDRSMGLPATSPPFPLCVSLLPPPSLSPTYPPGDAGSLSTIGQVESRPQTAAEWVRHSLISSTFGEIC